MICIGLIRYYELQRLPIKFLIDQLIRFICRILIKKDGGTWAR